MNHLEQLHTMTTVVADTGDIEAISQQKPPVYLLSSVIR
jgi:hypothetical protein